MMLLFVENSDLSTEVKEKIRARICQQLGQTWQGKRVDRAFVQSIHDDFDDELIGQFDTADRLAPLMTTASGIGGNPAQRGRSGRSFRQPDVAPGRRWRVQAVQPGETQHDAGVTHAARPQGQ